MLELSLVVKWNWLYQWQLDWWIDTERLCACAGA